MFHITTKSRYGLRSLVELAVKSEKEPISLKDISVEQNISKKYLENIFRMLQKNGIIRSTRGAKGGYQLACDPKQTSVLKVMQAIEGPVELLECIQKNDCKQMSNCPTRHLWEGLERCIVDYLDSRTLEMLIDYYQSKGKTFEGMYI